jgi:hydrogenase maturation protease
MRVLLVAVGNPLRRDDGIAHRVLEILDPERTAGVSTSSVHQLTPELAEEFSRHDAVIIVDADVEPGEAYLEEIAEPGRRASLGHELGAAEIVSLARTLYDWKGACVLCHVPGADFTDGGGFSDEAEGSAWRAAHLIEELLANPSPGPNP